MTTDVHLQTLETAAGAVEPSLVWVCEGGARGRDPDGEVGLVPRDLWHWSIYATTEPVDVVRAFYAKTLPDGELDRDGGEHWRTNASAVFADPWAYERHAEVDVVPLVDAAHLRCTDGRSLPKDAVTLVGVTGEANVNRATSVAIPLTLGQHPRGVPSCVPGETVVSLSDDLFDDLYVIDEHRLVLVSSVPDRILDVRSGEVSSAPWGDDATLGADGRGDAWTVGEAGAVRRDASGVHAAPPWTPHGDWSPVGATRSFDEVSRPSERGPLAVGDGLLMNVTYDDPAWWHGDEIVPVPGLPPRWRTRLVSDGTRAVAWVDEPDGASSYWSWEPGSPAWRRLDAPPDQTWPTPICDGGIVLDEVTLPDGQVYATTQEHHGVTVWRLKRP